MTSRWTEWRRRSNGPPQPREVQPCGTYAAARRHQRKGEAMDDACVDALRSHQQEMYRRRKS